MPADREIRADYNEDTIAVYQAYSPAIAEPALNAQRFVPPFSLGRMTWIKPSFLWLMERSNWAHKAGQERVLAVRISRTGWEEALAKAVLTDADPLVYPTYADWREQFDRAQVVVQWDPERSLRGSSLPHGSIQVGLSRHVTRLYSEEWTRSIEDYTSRVKKIAMLLRTGRESQARALLPSEHVYPLPPALRHRIGAT